MKPLLTFIGSDTTWDEGLSFRASGGSFAMYTLHYTRYCNIS